MHRYCRSFVHQAAGRLVIRERRVGRRRGEEGRRRGEEGRRGGTLREEEGRGRRRGRGEAAKGRDGWIRRYMELSLLSFFCILLLFLAIGTIIIVFHVLVY